MCSCLTTWEHNDTVWLVTNAVFLHLIRSLWWINHSFLCDFDFLCSGIMYSTPGVSSTTLSSSSFGGQVCLCSLCSLGLVNSCNRFVIANKSYLCFFVWLSVFIFLCRFSVWEWVEPKTRVQERRQQAWAGWPASISYPVDWHCQSATVSGYSSVANPLCLL